MAETLPGIRVIIVEDHADTRDILEQVLKHMGAAVTSVALAREALSMMQAADIIVTDLVLPVPREDGVWLLEQVNSHRRPIPVILVSGFAQDQVPRLAEAPFSRKLLKPIDPWELGRIIRDVVRPPSSVP